MAADVSAAYLPSLLLPTGGALMLIAAQVAAFALVAFPLPVLRGSVRALLGGVGEDRGAVAAGVFAALGRAAALAGFNAAVLMTLAPIVVPAVGLETAWLGAASAVVYGLLARLALFAPLEQRAFAPARARRR